MAAFLVATQLTACSTPAKRLDMRATQMGFAHFSVQGTEFTHTLLRGEASRSTHYLHVYLDGDGAPWINHTVVAQDPTPRNLLVLELMSLDPAATLYLGRPCYNGRFAEPPCSSSLWTSHRYSPVVVDSMVAVLETVTAEADIDGLIFIGYSGGGTLAMLLAERFEQTRAVLTIAGNLDPAAWAQLHRYSPLDGSLNPARRPPLSDNIIQMHYVGEKDTNVPPSLVANAISRQPDARLVVIDLFDHECCWTERWNKLLDELQEALLDSGG